MKPLSMLAALLWTIGVPIAAQAQSHLTHAERALMEFADVGNLEKVQRLVSEGTAFDAADAAQAARVAAHDSYVDSLIDIIPLSHQVGRDQRLSSEKSSVGRTPDGPSFLRVFPKLI